jgi:hypothetical protein
VCAIDDLLTFCALIRGESASDVKWTDLVTEAYFNRVDLSAHGFYIVPHARCGFGGWSSAIPPFIHSFIHPFIHSFIIHEFPTDWTIACPDGDNSKRGMPFNYFTQVLSYPLYGLHISNCLVRVWPVRRWR